MGRRKIEIEPITNERNRSVTFLKRKNGLFKKAYELGVLCSVDIAVIVFEERPGHPVKLHQYCSGNAHNVIQRHIRFDGVRELRGPHDFNDKHGELDEDDEDFMEEDEPEVAPPPPSRPSKSGYPSGSKATHRLSAARDIQPPTKRARLDSLSLDGQPSDGHLSNYRYTQQPHSLSYPPAHHHSSHPSSSSSSSGNLASLYPPPSSHSWSSVVSSALGSVGPGSSYRDYGSRDRAAAAAAAVAASYAAGGSSSSAFDFGAPPPNLRAAAAAAYAAGRADAYAAAAAASAASGPMSQPPPPLQASPAPPSAAFDDVFDFDWPVHQTQPGPSAPPPSAGAGAQVGTATLPMAVPSTSPSLATRAPQVKLARAASPDMSWLDFLSTPSGAGGAVSSLSASSASSAGSGGGGPGASGVWPALRRDDVWPEDARRAGGGALGVDAAGDRGRSAESAASGTSFLPSPVESDGEEWDGNR